MSENMCEQSPIVMFGAPRFGTTYLHQILNKHPDVFISHETRVFAWLHQSLNVLTRRDDFLVTCRDQFIEHLRAAYPDLIRDFYRRVFPGKRYWGDKNPHYADPVNRGCLETIAELFPGTKFIHILRDGRDVVSSLVRKRHASGEPWADFEMPHRVWVNHVEIGTTFGRSGPAESYFELKYEDLIRDDLALTERLFEFPKIDLHPALSAFCEEQQVRRTPFSGPTRDLSANPAASEWSQVFTKPEQRRSLDWLGPQLISLGYETEASLAQRREEIEQDA